jgi:hypothetical protein
VDQKTQHGPALPTAYSSALTAPAFTGAKPYFFILHVYWYLFIIWKKFKQKFFAGPWVFTSPSSGKFPEQHRKDKFSPDLVCIDTVLCRQ